MTQTTSFSTLSDRDLIAEVKRRAGAERIATAALVASLAEMDARRLYLGEGCSSLFTYCTRVLHLSEHAAYGRIEAARAARRFPVVLERLEQGTLTLSNLCLLRSHLTDENCLELLDTVRHASKRDVERLVAAWAPQPDAPAAIRRLPVPVERACAPSSLASANMSPTLAVEYEPSIALEGRSEPTASCSALDTCQPAAAAVSLTRPAATPTMPAIPVLRPLAPERYKVQFTVGRETHDKLRRAQDLLRHVVPDGDPAAIFDRALTLLLQQLERTKVGAARAPRPPVTCRAGSRHIPAAVRRAVWRRDEGRCAFSGTEGRCRETGLLEFHHVVPFARGGGATADNIELRCRAHNKYHAVEDFGPGALLIREAVPRYM